MQRLEYQNSVQFNFNSTEFELVDFFKKGSWIRTRKTSLNRLEMLIEEHSVDDAVESILENHLDLVSCNLFSKLFILREGKEKAYAHVFESGLYWEDSKPNFPILAVNLVVLKEFSSELDSIAENILNANDIEFYL